jgi:ABC-type uncharacterized transport system involved in gliding motility auxiliary subunit
VCVLLYILSQWREIGGSFSGRQARYGALSLASVLIVLGILVGINYVAGRQNKRWDFTSNQQFSLSDQTRKVLGSLKEPIKVSVYDRNESFRGWRDRFAEYEYSSKQVKVDYVDADKDAARARAAQIQQYGTVVVEYGGRTERITSNNEQDITNAIIKAVEGKQKKVYFVQGHGEKDTASSDERFGYSAIGTALGRDNFQVDSVVLAQRKDVPADASVLVVAGPTTDYLPAEIDMIKAYLAKGGKLLLMVDPPETPSTAPLTNLAGLAKDWGIEIGDGVVLDPVGQAIGMGAEAPVAATFPPHPITDRFRRLLTAFPLARPVSTTAGGGRMAQPVVQTSPESFSKKDLSVLTSGGEIQLDEAKGDKKGPITIAAAVSEPVGGAPDPEQPPPAPGTPPKPETRVVVFGDSDFATNSVMGVPGNSNLFLNTVNWLAQQENLIAIRPKDAEDRRVSMTADQQRMTMWLTWLIIPGLVFAMGMYTWWRRR